MVKILYSPADPKCQSMQANGHKLPQEFDQAIPELEDLVRAGLIKREEKSETISPAKEIQIEIEKTQELIMNSDVDNAWVEDLVQLPESESTNPEISSQEENQPENPSPRKRRRR